MWHWTFGSHKPWGCLFILICSKIQLCYWKRISFSWVIPVTTDLNEILVFHDINFYMLCTRKYCPGLYVLLKARVQLHFDSLNFHFGYFSKHISMEPWATTKKRFKLVWRCHQLLYGFLAKGYLPWVSRQSRRSLMIWVIMKWSWELCTDLRKSQLGDQSSPQMGIPFLQIRSVGPHSTPGREKEVNKELTGWINTLDVNCCPSCLVRAIEKLLECYERSLE